MFHFCTVHKIYLYIYMPNAFYAKKRVFIYHFGEVCIFVLIRASSHQFHMYQRCSQLFCLPKKVSSIITRSRLNRKHLCSTVTFWKQNKMKSIEAGKSGEKVKTAPSCTPLCHWYNYNLRLYIKKISLYATASHLHASSRSDYTQRGWKNQGVSLGKWWT